MNKKTVYHYPDFVSKVEIKGGANKRYWLKLTINEKQNENILII